MTGISLLNGAECTATCLLSRPSAVREITGCRLLYEVRLISGNKKSPRLLLCVSPRHQKRHRVSPSPPLSLSPKFTGVPGIKL
jgi:hypothetical protein